MLNVMKIFVLAIVFSLMTSQANAAPTCVFMKFTDDTRFIKAEVAASLSDMVMEKLIDSGIFNFKETKVIDQDMERLLFEGRTQEFQNAQAAAMSNNFDNLFNGAGYSKETAQDVATARVGQIIPPAITSAIGNQHNAEYLIQGTIRGIGTGDWMDTQVQNVIDLVDSLSSLSGGVGLGISFSQNVTKFGVQADLKVIRAATGEVVWQQVVIGKKVKKQSNIGIGGISFKAGSDKLDNKMYVDAMEDAVQKISDTLINAAKNDKLFI